MGTRGSDSTLLPLWDAAKSKQYAQEYGKEKDPWANGY